MTCFDYHYLYDCLGKKFSALCYCLLKDSDQLKIQYCSLDKFEREPSIESRCATLTPRSSQTSLTRYISYLYSLSIRKKSIKKN